MSQIDLTDRPFVDFGRAVPPQLEIVRRAMSQTLAELSAEPNLSEIVRVPGPPDSDPHRKAGAKWVAQRLGFEPEVDRVLLTHGTQNALSLVLTALVPPGGIIAAESLTYSSFRALAAYIGRRVVPIQIDEEGIIPDSFEFACRHDKLNVLYCNPTVHTPTTSVMPDSRRAIIIEIARRYGVPIIEDDVQGFLNGPSPRPLASLAPDHVWYVGAFGKSVTLGLRNAYLVAPTATALANAIAVPKPLTCWSTAALSAEIGTRWIDRGVAHAIVGETRAEARARALIAVEVLDGFEFSSHPASHHIWVAVPGRETPEMFCDTAQTKGLIVWPGTKFRAADGVVSRHVRLSLSHPDSREDVRRGLEILRDILSGRHAII